MHGIVGRLIRILPVNLNNQNIRFNTLQYAYIQIRIWLVSLSGVRRNGTGILKNKK